MHSRTRSVSGTQAMAAGWAFAVLQNQLDRIVRNKAIYLKVATALGLFSTLDPFSAASSTSSALSSACFFEASRKLPVAQCHEHRHENEIDVSFFALSYDSHMNRSRPHAFT